MIAVFTYLIKFSVALTFVYVFYALLLKRLTFYNWNRLFLLSYSLACFFIPFINLDSWLNKPENNNVLLQAIPPFNQLVPITTNNINQIVFIFFVAGCSVVFLKLIIQILSLRRINKTAVLLHQAGSIRIYSTNAGSSFTLGNNIYLDTVAKHSPDEIEKVLQHEMIHVKQKHWIDLIAGELLCIVNWFNPFAWLLRASIRQNLEYIADRQVLHRGYDLKEYQYLLLKISASQHAGIAAHFSFSGLKNRIYMINKIKSARVHLAKFVLIFPLMLLLLFAFRTVSRSPIGSNVFVRDTIPSDSTKERILIGVISDTLIGEIEDTVLTVKQNSKKYRKPRKPPVPPVPPVPPIPEAPAKSPPPPPAQPAAPAKSAEPAVPTAPVAPAKVKINS